jgi:hypothetical protein
MQALCHAVKSIPFQAAGTILSFFWKTMTMEDKNREIPSNESGAGRTHNQQGENGNEGYQPVKQSDDISAIDQQEGTMHNGVTGGNFTDRSEGDGAEGSEKDA